MHGSGACVAGGGMHGRGGMCGRGACVVGRHACQGACVAGGAHTPSPSPDTMRCGQ